MNVGDFCTREVVIASRETTILEAAGLMRSHNVGDIVVVEERDGRKVPVGILTDRDIVVKLLAEGVDTGRLNTGDVMSLELHTAGEDADLLDTLQLMRRRGIRRVPVVGDGGGLIGIITLDDMIEVVAEQMNSMVSLLDRERSN